MKNNYGIDEKYLLLLGFKIQSNDKTLFEKYYRTPIGLFSIYVSLISSKFWIYTYEIKNRQQNIVGTRELKINRLPKVLNWLERKEGGK